MKEKIYKFPNGKIHHITNRNNSGQLHGLCVGYNSDGGICYIQNWINGKDYGLETVKYSSAEIKQEYYL